MISVQIIILITLVALAVRATKNGGVSKHDMAIVLILLVVNFATLFFNPYNDNNQHFNSNVRYNYTDTIMIRYIDGDINESLILEDIQTIANVKEFKDETLILDKGVVVVDSFGHIDNSKSYVERYSIPVEKLSDFNFYNLKKYRDMNDKEIINTIFKHSKYTKINAIKYVDDYKKNLLIPK